MLEGMELLTLLLALLDEKELRQEMKKKLHRSRAQQRLQLEGQEERLHLGEQELELEQRLQLEERERGRVPQRLQLEEQGQGPEGGTQEHRHLPHRWGMGAPPWWTFFCMDFGWA